jgi:hypothetical protein
MATLPDKSGISLSLLNESDWLVAVLMLISQSEVEYQERMLNKSTNHKE